MLTLEQFGSSTGKIVSSKTSQSILSLSSYEVLKQFRLSGLLDAEHLKILDDRFFLILVILNIN